MALFEFERGRLIPAQFGRPVEQGLGPDVLESLRSQVLEVIGRPLFPVTWQVPETETTPDGGPHCLTALDPAGQVVSVEVLQRLDAVSLVMAMGRLGMMTRMGWIELAHAYPGGPDAFRAGWADFREAMPPTVSPGPKLFLVVGDVDPGVESALLVLASAGVEIHQVRLREMSNGRRFLEAHPVSITAFSPRTQLGGHSAPAPQLEWSGTETVPASAAETPTAHRDVPPAPPSSPAEPDLGFDASGLRAIADVLGQPTVLLHRTEDGDIVEALLSADGLIDVGDGALTSDADEAFARATGSQGIGGWRGWHLGILDGPTLAEAVAEMTRYGR